MKKSKAILLLLFIFVIALLFGCSDGTSGSEIDGGEDTTTDEVSDENGADEGSDDTEPEYKEFANEPVTLKVATPWDDDLFYSRIGDYVEENLDHITLENVNWDRTTEGLEELYAAGVVPDVILAAAPQHVLEEVETEYPLEDILEEYGVDISHIQEPLLDEIRSRDSQGRLVGLPQEVGAIGLFYNKTVFDLFGEPYPDPEIPMTWDEFFELADRVSGELNGVYYHGVEMTLMEEVPLWQLSATKVDPETGEVLIASDPKFAQWMGLVERYYNRPNIEEVAWSMGSGSTAMMIGWHGFLHEHGQEDPDEAVKVREPFDIAPLPVWPDQPNIGVSPQGVHPWAINAHSENKEAALQFILLGTSEEYQLEMARQGTPSILDTPEAVTEFGANRPEYQGKNLEALFALTPAEPEQKSRWDQYVVFDMGQYQENNWDIQEYLRVTKEETEIKIADVKSQEDIE